jgi:hypothetical protein
MPWTNVSYSDALAHCQAVHPDATLCSMMAWGDACSCGAYGTTGSPLNYDYGWSYASCSDPYDGTTCNGADFAGSDDSILAGGSAADCRRPLSGSDVYDLSGNVKELTLARTSVGAACNPATDADCTIMVRGGSSNNTAAGTACGYVRSFWPNDAPFYNVGFRCCMDVPATPVCETFPWPGPALVGSGANTVATLIVPLSGTITDVNVLGVTGTTADINDFEFRLAHGSTTVRLVDNPCANNLAGFNVSFDDEAAAGAVPCNPYGQGGTYRPNQTLSAFDGASASGSWTLTLADTDGGADAITLNGWTLRICGF